MGLSLAGRPVHYALVIILAGILTVFACLGMGRFALGMLLPSMGADLSLSYAQMGVISTGNFVGYLSGVLICGALVRRAGARTVILCGLLAVAVSMMAVGSLSLYPAIIACYFVTGMGSAFANIAVMGLVANWFAPNRRGRAAGLMVMGSGFGIMLSGTLIPFLNAALAQSGWRYGWFILGALVLVCAAVCGSIVRNDPASMKLSPLGAETPGSGGSPGYPPPAAKEARWTVIAHLGAIYFLFGFTYVIYTTFIVTTLVQDLGYSEIASGKLWVWLGFFSLFSGPVFGGLSDRIGRRSSMMIVFFLQTCAYLLAGLHLSGAWIYLSIVLFGFAVWSIPSILTATLGDYLPRDKVTTALGHLTFIFGIGQILGPALAGLLADASGTFHSSYLLAASMTSIAFILTAVLRQPAAALPPAPSPSRSNSP